MLNENGSGHLTPIRQPTSVGRYQGASATQIRQRNKRATDRHRYTRIKATEFVGEAHGTGGNKASGDP